jgi:hypothetical protein
METGFNAFKSNNYIYVLDKAEPTYNKLIDYKINKLMVPLFGEPNSVGTIPAISKETYSKSIYEHYKRMVSLNSDPETKVMVDNFLSQFSDDEILSNKTMRSIVVGNRTYQPGTKVFRLLHKFAEVNDMRYNFENKIFNQLNLQDDMIKPILLTVRPEHFLQATRASDSCFRIGGEQEGSAMAYPTLPYAMMAYAEDLSWRAFVYFSPEEKRFTQMPGYSRENFYAQVAVKEFFESKGYTMTSHYHFHHGFYQDSDVFFGSIAELKGVPRHKRDNFLDTDLYKGYAITNSDYINITAAYCDGCDNIHVGFETFENGMCETCENWVDEYEAEVI